MRDIIRILALSVIVPMKGLFLQLPQTASLSMLRYDNMPGVRHPRIIPLHTGSGSLEPQSGPNSKNSRKPQQVRGDLDTDSTPSNATRRRRKP